MTGGSGAERPPILSCRPMSPTRRLALLGLPGAFVAILGLLVLDACSSSAAPTDSYVGPSGCPADPFAVDGLDKVKTDRLTVCNRYVAALKAKADSLHCSLTPVPECPKAIDDFEALLRGSDPTICIDNYSAGAIANCECRIAAYTSCKDFDDHGDPDAGRPAKVCRIGVFPDDPSKKCSADAGVDADALSPLDDAPGDAGGGG